jgi:hypothetical protein
LVILNEGLKKGTALKSAMAKVMLQQEQAAQVYIFAGALPVGVCIFIRLCKFYKPCGY